MADFSHAREWDPGVRSAERIDAGPIGTGTGFRLTAPMLGARLVLIYRISRYQPPAEVVLEVRHWLLTGSDTIGVSAGDAATVVSYLAEVRLRRPFSVLEPALSAGFSRAARRAAEGLSAALAGNPARR